MNRQALHDQHATKAEALFALRCLRECLHTAAPDARNKDNFLERLLNLQCSIYNLDEYGERNWTIDASEIANIWQAIRLSWSAVPTRAAERPPLTEVAEYQKIEIKMRDGRRPDM